MRKRKGFTLVELMVGVVLAAIGLFAVTSLLYSAYVDLFASREIKALQEDMDIAALTVKSVLEEAGSFTIDQGGEGITAGYSNPDMGVNWEKSFFRDGSNLMLDSEVIIKTLESINFYQPPSLHPEAPDEWQGLQNTVAVEIIVSGSGRAEGRMIENLFLVRRRN